MEPGSSVPVALCELRDILCRDLPVHSAAEQNKECFAPSGSILCSDVFHARKGTFTVKQTIDRADDALEGLVYCV